MSKSVLQEDKECYVRKTTLNLEEHHIFRSPYRNNSEKYGLKVWLCQNHHTGNNGVHNGNVAVDMHLKKLAQRKFEETHTRKEFIRKFGRNYL